MSVDIIAPPPVCGVCGQRHCLPDIPTMACPGPDIGDCYTLAERQFYRKAHRDGFVAGYIAGVAAGTDAGRMQAIKRYETCVVGVGICGPFRCRLPSDCPNGGSAPMVEGSSAAANASIRNSVSISNELAPE